MTEAETIAATLEEIADLLEAKGVEFKPRAYRQAAETVRTSEQSIVSLAEEGPDALAELEHIGEAIATKIVEFVETGSIEELESLQSELPVDMAALTRVEGLGPKRVGALYEALGICTLEELQAAAEAGKIQEVAGFGPKSEQNILERISFAKRASARQLLSTARPIADEILSRLQQLPDVDDAEVAGSLRRWKETVGDVDILVGTHDATTVVQAVEADAFAAELIESGEKKASIRTDDGIRVDFRFVDPETYGAALQYFTGSKDHNVQLRRLALSRGLSINEYGVFEEDSGERVAGETESSVYGAVDLPWIEPELREARGELETATAGELPDLVRNDDIRGDLHVHTDWSDGAGSIDDMLTAAENFGYDFIAITDHATGPGVPAGIGLTDEELLQQSEQVNEAAQSHEVTVFHGVEANIDATGDISIGEDVFQTLDLVIASPHAALSQDRETATDRLITAIEHPAVDIIGHPTGRKLNKRPGLPIDITAVAEAAATHNVALEVNSHPVRLDLSGPRVQSAIETGASIAISTDSHHPEELTLMTYGVHTARRGWAQPTDVLNASTTPRDLPFYP